MPGLEHTILIPLIPFFAFLVIGLLNKTLSPKVAGMIGITGILASTILAYQVALGYFFSFGQVDGVFQKIIAYKTSWLQFTDSLVIEMGAILDPISAMMLVVITTVSSLVFIYSWGYMKGESGFSRFYAFLSLFSFSMLGLVLATNLFQMYMFWELVGVSSYLLIGFYYDKAAAVAASKKAFIVTRFADLGFLIGILLLSFHTGTFDFQLLTDPNGPAITSVGGATFMGLSVVSLSLLLIFIGGAGKSAMFPLHIWLPDAMEGPTPVSALIHAATMVVAGVYLVARLFPVFAFAAPEALEVVAYIGAFTALFAAVVACTQPDIKRVLAYSTMSQIGYMMLALGVSGFGEDGLGYTASMFHLFTHAFFKALLFLGAGSIIHAVHTNDIFKMGGLRKFMPITHITFLIACLAIAGIPPFAGFFSKDEILAAALVSNKLIFGVGFAVAGLTAFYMFRLYFMVFWNEAKIEGAPHESPSVMTIPLIILAIGSLVAGFVPFNELVTSNGSLLATELHWEVAAPSVAIGLIGIVVAMVMYRKASNLPSKLSSSLGGIYKAAYSKFYIDEVYMFVTKKVIFNLISRPIAWFDRNIIDAFMDMTAKMTNLVSEGIKEMQSGQLHYYAIYFASGAILFVVLMLWMR